MKLLKILVFVLLLRGLAEALPYETRPVKFEKDVSVKFVVTRPPQYWDLEKSIRELVDKCEDQKTYDLARVLW